MIGARVWRSSKFRALKNTDARLLYLYLHTCTHGNSAGCFHISPTLIAAEAGVEGVDEALTDLEDVGLILRDPSEDLVQLRSFFAFNVPHSRKQLAGPLAVLEALPRGRLRDAVSGELAVAVHEKALTFSGDHDARGAFMHHAAELMRGGGISSVNRGDIALSDAQRIALSEDLLIALSIQGHGKDQGKDQDHGEDHGEDQDHGEGAKSAQKPDQDIQDTISELQKKAGASK